MGISFTGGLTYNGLFKTRAGDRFWDEVVLLMHMDGNLNDVKGRNLIE